jgi:inosine-uridine nucleoside N-ribohydrolase
MKEALRFYVDFHQQAEGLDGCIVNDVLPIALLLRPAVLGFEERRLVVDFDVGQHRGHTRVDPGGVPVRVATRVDMAPVHALMAERVFRWATRAPAAPIAEERATA